MLTQRVPRRVRPQEILLTYQRILEERPPEPDEERSTVKNHLKLSGVVKRRGPHLVVRNRIYRETFDQDWVKQQLPTGELARQLWRKLTTTLAPVAILVSLLLALLTVFAFYQANQAGESQRTAEEARQIAEDQRVRAERAEQDAQKARNAARIEHLSASGLLAAYSPSPYAGDQRRASLLVRQAWNMTRTEQLPDNRLENLPKQAMSNLLRANQVIGHLRSTLQGHSASVTSVAFSPDGARVVSGSGDNSLRLWDAAIGQPIGEPWQGHGASVYSVAFSPDGARVVSGSGDNTLRLWDAATGQPIGEPWQGHSAWVTSVAFSPDGARVASGSGDNSLRLWDAATGQPIGEPWQGHSAWVTSVAFSPDGARVASGSGDNTLRLWDAATGQPIGAPWQGHSAWVLSVAFSPDGGRVVSGSGDNPNSRWDYMLLIWEVDEDSWKRRGCAIAGRNLSLTEWRRYLPGRPYEKTCPDYPVHPEVIVDALTKAAQHWGEGEAEERLEEAILWIEEMLVLHDRISLLWENMDSLAREHPIRPALADHIRQWMDELPAPNRAYWEQRMGNDFPDDITHEDLAADAPRQSLD